mgnify:CR=1 FL=1
MSVKMLSARENNDIKNYMFITSYKYFCQLFDLSQYSLLHFTHNLRHSQKEEGRKEKTFSFFFFAGIFEGGVTIVYLRNSDFFIVPFPES